MSGLSESASKQEIRGLIQSLPLPIAQLVLRALNAKSAPERHHNAYYLAECILKLAAAARVGVWIEHALSPGSDLARKLEALVLPSTGQWCECLRELSRALGDRKDAALLPFGGDAAELVRNRPEWTHVRAFVDCAIRENIVPDDAARKSLKRGVMGFFEVIVAYRNDVIGHGAQRSDAFYDELGEKILNATIEVLKAPCLLGGMELVQARQEAGPQGEKPRLVYYGLTGLGGLPLDRAADGAIAEQLYLIGPIGRAPLHPLVVLQREDELGRERVGFINRTLRRSRKSQNGEVDEIRRADYLDYSSGQSLRDVDVRACLGAFLSKLRGNPVTASDLRAAEDATLSDVRRDSIEEEPAQGASIGDFELLGELGRGSMGIVYKALQRSLRRMVALKVLPPSLYEDSIARKRFAREIAALARCDHPNVVKILASGEDGNRLYYAMEYVEGADLGRAFDVLSSWRGEHAILREGHLAAAVSTSSGRERPRLSDKELPQLEKIPPPAIASGKELADRLAELFAEAADGLAHLHAAGIIHRDLKPSNLMLTSDGKRIVIMDLGLAKLQDESKALTSADVKILGTLRYMAPEQLHRKLVEIDERADIYSLGAALYELVTGRPLFDGDTEQRLIYQVLHEEPLPPRRIDKRISPDLAAVLAVATNKSKNLRYASATAFAEDLRSIAERRPIRAKPPGAFRRALLWTSRSGKERSPVMFGALLLVMLPLAFLGTRAMLAPRLCAAGDLQDCTRQCQRGHLGSCYTLGSMYENGAGIPKDQTKAVEAYQTACKGGNVVACYSLGSMVEDGRGGEENKPEAARLYAVACEGNSPQGCNALGRLVGLGIGVPQDFKRAVELYQKACEGGYANACSNLGRQMDKGEGTTKDPSAARGMYEKACNMGSAAGCGNLAAVYVEGSLVPKDETRAAALYKQGCDGGYAFSCTGLGLLYETGRGLPKDDAHAASLYKRACDQNEPMACMNLGRLVDEGRGVEKDDARARLLFQQGCDGGEWTGCHNVALMYLNGQGVTKDEARAASLFETACKHGEMHACTALGRMREQGQGGPVDATAAADLLQKACSGGDTDACIAKSPPVPSTPPSSTLPQTGGAPKALAPNTIPRAVVTPTKKMPQALTEDL